MDNVYVGIVPQSAAFSGLGDLEAQLGEELKQKLTTLGENLGIPSRHLHILNGSPAHEIHRFANENDVQLIVIGTHGQKGLQLLLGSTANAVLHGAGCDVLSVRIGAAK
jgi:universal stress protein A